MDQHCHASAVKISVLYIQICVPNEWTDEEVLEWANTHQPTGMRGVDLRLRS